MLKSNCFTALRDKHINIIHVYTDLLFHDNLGSLVEIVAAKCSMESRSIGHLWRRIALSRWRSLFLQEILLHTIHKSVIDFIVITIYTLLTPDRIVKVVITQSNALFIDLDKRKPESLPQGFKALELLCQERQSKRRINVLFDPFVYILTIKQCFFYLAIIPSVSVV